MSNLNLNDSKTLDENLKKMCNYLTTLIIDEERNISPRLPSSALMPMTPMPCSLKLNNFVGPVSIQDQIPTANTGATCSNQRSPRLTFTRQIPFVTSALNRSGKSNLPSTSKIVNITQRKRRNIKPIEYDLDYSFDVDTAMAELNLTKELFGDGDVRKLFCMFQTLSFYIYLDYISTSNTFQEINFPVTFNVSVQTKHAVSGSLWLHTNLSDLLRGLTIPFEYRGELVECLESLKQLELAISDLKTYKNYKMEHSGGKLQSLDDRRKLNSMLGAMNFLIESIGKCRLNIEALEWAVKEKQGTGSYEKSSTSSSD